MANKPPLLPRIWNRLARIPLLQRPIQRANDLARHLSFRLHPTIRKADLNAYENCRTAKDFHSFILRIPGVHPHQNEKEIVSFCDFAAAKSPVNVCEIGTADGGTNFLLAQANPSVKFMLGVDLFVKNTHCLQYFSRPGQELRFLNGSSYAPGTLQEVRSLLAERKLDLLFIDGDHTYNGVKKDFLLYKDFVREGGIIAFHDIIPDYKTRYGRDTGNWAGEVPVFWQKIRACYPNVEFIQDPDQDGRGIGSIEYRVGVQLPPDL